MSEEFIGWKVKLTTKSGSIIEGVVSEVDDSDSRLTLTSVTLTVGKRSRSVELVSVLGHDITDLQVIKQQSAAPQSPKDDFFNDPAIIHARPATSEVVGSKAAIKNTASWANDNVTKLKKTEFDFQNNLLLFDKQRVFDDLKNTLSPDELLINQNSPKRMASADSLSSKVPALAPSRQKVLSKDQLFDSLKSKSEEPIQSVKFLQKSKKEEPKSKEGDLESPVAKIDGQFKDSVRLFDSICVVGGGQKQPIVVPVVTEEQMGMIEQRASKQTGPTTDQQIESAARETAQILINQELKCIPRNVIVLAGNHREGALSLAIGRTLANRGIPVSVYLVNGLSNDHVAFQKRLFGFAGGKIYESFDKLKEAEQPIDLIVDGVLGRMDVSSFAHKDLISWVSKQESSFIVSLEQPISSKSLVFTIAFPKAFHPAIIAKNGPIYLVDIGLPVGAYKSVIPDFDPFSVFGTKYSVRIR